MGEEELEVVRRGRRVLDVRTRGIQFNTDERSGVHGRNEGGRCVSTRRSTRRAALPQTGLEGAKSPKTDAEYEVRSFLRRVWMFSTISVSTVGVDAVMLMITGFVGGLPSSMGVVRMS